jgi:glutathione S-transferase
MMPTLPTLFTFRRCPYAIRARMAIAMSKVAVTEIEVDLKHKPAQMLALSPKATVPVLVLTDGSVIDESLDIMKWALRQNDPMNVLEVSEDVTVEIEQLIARNDSEFKALLDRYKYPERYPEFSARHYRDQAENFLHMLDSKLVQRPYLAGEKPSLADFALLPFVRQFHLVDKQWFDTSPHAALRKWLENWLNSDLLIAVMHKKS